MDRIQVKVIVEVTDTSKISNWSFTEDWNFLIDKFQFKVLNEKELEVSFYFDKQLEKRENGVSIMEMPSEHTEELQEPEEQLETILDLISLQTGVGLKIRKGSYELTYRGGSTLRVSNNLKLRKLDTDAISKQYKKIQSSSNKGLSHGLRSYHRSLWYDDPSEKVPKLYSVFEQLFGDGIGGSLLTKEELSAIEKFFQENNYDAVKQEVLLKRLKDTPALSINEALVKKIKLMNSQGDVPEEEVREMLREWRSTRGKAAHGVGLPRRQEEIDLLLWDLESTAESFLYSHISPSLLQYLLFNDKDISKDFIDRKSKLLSNLGDGYFALPIRHSEINVYLDSVGHKLSSNSCVYIISHNSVMEISKSGSRQIDPKTLEEKLQEHIDKVINKLNR